LAQYDENEEAYYVDYSPVPLYSGEVVAPRFLKHDIDKLYKLLEGQVKVYGRNQFRGLLAEVGKLRGY